ncbi:MAG: methyl-accepting chemotaxis protein, partial [Caldimicrobium sp.]
AKALMSSSEEQFKETQQLVFSMDKIREISDTIKGIAEQTNLLALNASIEAARAGEAGKGFAVVANEVKELARKVSEFIGEIERTIDELSDRVNAVAKKAKESKEQAIEVENSTSVIANAVEEQTAVINSIIEYVMETREKSFNFISDVEALNKDSLTLESITKDLRISTELLSEIGETLTKVEEVIEIDVKAPSDEELSQMSVISLIKLGILGHINWKVNFIKDVLIGKMPQVERDHRRCLLGRSMQYLEKKLSGTPIFKTLSELEEPHAKLHGLVERLEREVKIDNKEEALKFIEEEVIPIFKKVIGGLKEILKECIRLGCN